ncbi:MAG: thiol:disulfide interchange protein [Owenweeksia sp.]|nr:thiol:disulfide interchange protein [Owenweeksia sp.]MBF99548.1 thiol:disulfide interchange protein [Owenweeksia sp.]HBF19594.1 thiol:disulfide interchange protein [Cryomorphaceae bacterium]HCQ16905.1 thiol:disulfide interchange protein [Cryomorphaceae bacterium]|tara:strand:- start:2224 stop:4233 length:2010 start_codon:yes stop_codon:yes gene_type:complete
MRFFQTIAALLCFGFSLSAQILDPVDWTFSVNRLSDTEAELLMTATIDEGWHIYSYDLDTNSSVIPTDVVWTDSEDFTLNGDVIEPQPVEEYDKSFQETLRYHEGKVSLRQKILIHSSADFKVTGELTYMTCNDEGCLPPDYIDLEFEVKGAENPVTKESLEIDYANPDTAKDTDTTDDPGEVSTSSGDKNSRSLLSIFITSFLFGFAALLTPCVFPMIPLTVSFFTKQSKSRAKGISNAVIYGVSIIVLYTGMGYLITAFFGADAMNAFSTNPYVNIAFFILLVVFAISFFGAFEITLPSSWVNRTDKASDKGGIIGIFFMAFTLALVSFSCTGPIIGTLLFEASSGGIRGPLVGMFGFSLALALPFALFAAFPGWLNSLPKSGGWLNSVKVVLGFIELAFAFKFLSNADLVWGAHLLLREHFIAIWIAIFLLITFYLLGMFRMPHDSPLEKISVFRLILATFTLCFVIYLLPGMWGAPLKVISGFPPPEFYAESPGGFGSGGPAATSSGEIPEGADPEHCPKMLNCFHDFETGLAYAKEMNKPIMLDFTGWACVNCRKMEEQVWSDPRVLEILRNDIVLISLYVDERTKLPEDQQYVSPVTGKKIRTVGNKWSEFQVIHYQNNSQPQYVLLDHDSMEPLNGTTAYDPDIELYVKWLEEGINRFEAQQ